MSYELPGYDAWLERPYQRQQAQEPPGDVQDMLGIEFWLDGEHAVVDSYEEWEDADEDGRYGGIDFVIRTGGIRRDGPLGPSWTGGRTRNMSPTDLQDVLSKQDEHRGED
jgi:hypothetical protein